MDRRTLTERTALFGLGGLALVTGAVASGGLPVLLLPIAALAVVAGLVEAAAVRRTGRRHWVGAWLPAVAGMLALAGFEIATGPQGPDAGLALSIVVAAAVVIVPVFALVVLAVAAVALRVRPPAVPDGDAATPTPR